MFDADDFALMLVSEQISVMCPYCAGYSNLDRVAEMDLVFFKQRERAGVMGFRICPGCRTPICFALNCRTRRLDTLPPQRLGFDETNLPPKILEALKEAVECHAHGCYVAAAIMIRKALELLCEDKKATGNNLKDRLADLRTVVLIPVELLDATNELRLLGNDAAHVESKVFDSIGQEEIEAAIAFAKEILKSVYQYSALLQQLRALKK